MLRSDTAGYQQELLRYCAEGRDRRFGVIGFAVGVDVTREFKEAARVAGDEWRELEREDGGGPAKTGQEYAEVNFVPNWIGHSKNSPEYRFIAIREPLRNPPLPGFEGQLGLPSIMEAPEGGWYKVFGVVTNRDLDAGQLVWWSRQRCGKGEEVHSVLKEDRAGGCPRGQRRLVGHNGIGLQPELGDEAVGPGSRVGEPKAEGGALPDHLPSGTGDPSCPEPGHQPEPWPPLLHGVARCWRRRGGASSPWPTGRRGADPALAGPKATKTGPDRVPGGGLRPEPAGNSRPSSPCSFVLHSNYPTPPAPNLRAARKPL